MLIRTLEPEVMDDDLEALEYDQADFTAPNTKLAEDAIDLLRGLKNPRVLDLGTGTARIPLLLLDRLPHAHVVAVDMSSSMLAIAARNVAASAHRDHIELVKMDGKAVALPAASFDLVMSNSVAHHIPDPIDLFREVRRLVRPNGAVLVRDLFRPKTLDEAKATVARCAANESPKQRELFLASLCAALRVEEVRRLVDAADLSDLRVEEVSERHWTAERPCSWKTAHASEWAGACVEA